MDFEVLRLFWSFHYVFLGETPADHQGNMSEKDSTEIQDHQVLQLPVSKPELDEFISSLVQKIIPKDVEIANRRKVLSASIQLGRAEREWLF